ARSSPRDLSHEFNTGHDRIEVIAIGVIALIEIAKVDVRGLAGIRRFQQHPAGGVLCVRLENDPREIILCAAVFAVLRMVAGEITGNSEQVKVRIGLAMTRSLDDRDDRAVGGVEPMAVAPFAVFGIVFKGGIIGLERSIPKDFELGSHLVNHADFIAVLEVLADAGQRNGDLNVVSPELTWRADAGQHEQLWRIEGAAGENHLPLGADGSSL